MKKLLALLLAVLMAASLSIAALADHSGTEHGGRNDALVSSGVTEIPGTSDSAAAQGATEFYAQVDRDATSREGTKVVENANVEGQDNNWYDVQYTVTKKSSLNVTVPLYVCMYAYGGDGSVVVPATETIGTETYNKYRMENKSTRAVSNKIDSITPYYYLTPVMDGGVIKDNNSDGIPDQYTYKVYKKDSSPTNDHADTDNTSTTATLYTYVGDGDPDGTQRTDPNTFVQLMRADGSFVPVSDTDSTAALFYKGESGVTKFKGKDQINSEDAYYAVGEEYPGARDHTGTYSLAVTVSEIKAEKIDGGWSLLSVENTDKLAARQFSMSIKGYDLADALDKTIDITSRRWTVPGPTKFAQDTNDSTKYNVTETGKLSLPIAAAIAGNSVNVSGHADFVKVTYTIIPGEQGTADVSTLTG